MWNKIKSAANNLSASVAGAWTAKPLPAAKPQATGIAGAAENAAVALGRRLRSLGDTLHDRPSSIGLEGAAAFTAAKGLQSAGRYLETEGFHGAVDDVAGVVKRHPLPFLALGFGLGIVLGRMTSGRR